MATALRSISFVFAALLLLAVAHKGTAIASGAARAEPLMRLGPWRRRHATALLAAAATVEILICIALLIRPAVGFAALSVLALSYAVNLRKLSPNDGCNCFGSAFESRSRGTAILRNAGIAAISAVGAVLYASSAVPVAPVTQLTVGVALLLGAAATSIDLLRYIPRAERPTPQTGVPDGPQ
jgi:Methylamine utilisation protein MauE